MHRSLISILILPCIISGCTIGDHDVLNSGKILFNDNWEFVIDSFGFTEPGRFLKKKAGIYWEPVSLPHTSRIESLIVKNQWQGNCWYRKTFPTRDEWAGKKIFLRFEGAMNTAELWINGKKKITHLGGYLPFVAEVTDDILKEGMNYVYVRLNNEDNPITGPKPLENLDFNMYGGLYRDVFLIVKNRIHITDEQLADKVAGGGIFVTCPLVSGDRAVVSIKTNLMNSSDQAERIELVQLLKRNNKILSSGSLRLVMDPGTCRDATQELEVSGPHLWSPESPRLYILETLLKQKDKILDRSVTRIGIRKFEFHDQKLFINGKETFLRGVNYHQEYPYIGYALSNNAHFRDAVKIKEAGFDYVRLSHYPHSTAFMDACDELGIVVIDAILGWQYYNPDTTFQSHVFQTVRDMIRRDRNHPSVLAWEVSLNESPMPESFVDSLVGIAHEEYPAGDCFTAGWQEYGFDIYIQARQHRIGHPADLPDKPYIVSEYGDWEYYAMNAGFNQDAWNDLLPEERSSRQALGSGDIRLLQQALNIQEAHNDNLCTPAAADAYWAMFDYNRGYADDLEMSGIMNIFRLPKFGYYFFRSQRDPGEQVNGTANTPLVFIANYRDEGSPDDVRVFSNCDKVELLLNGLSLGELEPDRDEISEKLKHPPFTFRDVPPGIGELAAVGRIGGHEVARHRIASAGDPASILLETDISGRSWESGCKDVIFVYARVLDRNDRIVYNFNDRIDFNLSGNASIIGESSPEAEGGIASVLLMAGNEPDTVTVTAKTGGIKSKPCLIETE